MKTSVTLIDYGVGNLLSVHRALEKIGANVVVSSDPKIIRNSNKIVLPGVGAFPVAMKSLYELNLVSTIQDYALTGKPLLAICLGMQLLMDESNEFKTTPGLGLISGGVVPIPKLALTGEPLKSPSVGWYSLNRSNSETGWENTLLSDNLVSEYAYFTHSFMVKPTIEKNCIADYSYGAQKIPAVIQKNQITGCQFHPEKSGPVGLKILHRFLRQ